MYRRQLSMFNLGPTYMYQLAVQAGRKIAKYGQEGLPMSMKSHSLENMTVQRLQAEGRLCSLRKV